MRPARLTELLLICLIVYGGTVSAAEDIPEVLRYAKQYSQANAESTKQKEQATDSEDAESNMTDARLTRKLARSELIRRQQKVQLRMLEKKIQAMGQHVARPSTDVLRLKTENDQLRNDLTAIKGNQNILREQLNKLHSKNAALQSQQKLMNTLKPRVDALGGDLTAAIGSSGTDVRASESRLKEQENILANLRSELKSVQKKVGDLQREKGALLAQAGSDSQNVRMAQQKVEAALKEKADELDKQTVALKVSQEQLASLVREKDKLEKTINELELNRQPDTTIILSSARLRQSYAAGVMYARDVKDAQAGNQILGVKLDRAALVAGLSDALMERPFRLKEQDIKVATKALETAAVNGFDDVIKAQAKQAEAWLTTFRKEKGVKWDKNIGFWYQVIYEGDGDWLKSEDTVDVVVEESLTDGKVISDMDRTGSSLRQKVAEFPPVFASGLSRLKNHGQITLVVPPEQAYGDNGYPPDVPPGATMVYRVRVADKITAGGVHEAVASDHKAKSGAKLTGR